ncbi:MAG: hypothetical protein C4334_08565 [Pyrinomonas sp.]|uniref:glycosyltransferase family 4 protein n=1 Tax=Pyrinomonas sp. TaxID=2080306 RepID=UPI00332223CB
MFEVRKKVRVKVLHFTDVINRFDFIDNIIRHIDKDSFEVGLCLSEPKSNIQSPSYAEDFPLWVVPSRGRRHFLHVARALARILQIWDADIVHTHHYDQAVIGWLATRMRSQTKLIVGRHYSDAIYRLSSGMKRSVYLKVEGVVNDAAARIIVPSKYIFDILVNRQGVDPSKVDIVYYGFDPQKYHLPDAEEAAKAREALGLEGRFVVGTFARLHEEKGHRFLLEAISQVRERIPQLFWVVVGEGPERSVLEREVEARSLQEKVRFLGWRKDAIKIMAIVDAVVQPTLQEAFSQVMAEAMWMGKPLVITDVSGAVDIIRHGENGMMVPKADPAALSSVLVELATNSRLRANLGVEGRRFVEDNLIIEKIIGKYQESYLRAL